MIDWRWECFERYTHSWVFSVTDAGPLLSPIRMCKINIKSRDRGASGVSEFNRMDRRVWRQ